MGNLVKTTVTLPRPILNMAREMGLELGLGRNGFIAAAVARYCVEMAALVAEPRKRQQRLRDVEKEFQKLIQTRKKFY